MPKKATAKWRWWQQVENCSRFSILKQCRLKFRKRFAFLFFLILGYTKLISCSAGAHPLFWAQGIYIYIYIYIYIFVALYCIVLYIWLGRTDLISWSASLAFACFGIFGERQKYLHKGFYFLFWGWQIWRALQKNKCKYFMYFAILRLFWDFLTMLNVKNGLKKIYSKYLFLSCNHLSPVLEKITMMIN